MSPLPIASKLVSYRMSTRLQQTTFLVILETSGMILRDCSECRVPGGEGG
jgi:hypothetical protein